MATLTHFGAGSGPGAVAGALGLEHCGWRDVAEAMWLKRCGWSDVAGEVWLEELWLEQLQPNV